MVISTIVIRVSECSRLMNKESLSKTEQKSNYGTISVYKRVQMENRLMTGALFVILTVHV